MIRLGVQGDMVAQVFGKTSDAIDQPNHSHGRQGKAHASIHAYYAQASDPYRSTPSSRLRID